VSTAERIRFVPGAELTARDLHDEVAAESGARAAHVREVHGTWGAGLGYSVGVVSRWVIVGPGLAYDCHGRELLSARTVALEPPPDAEGWFELSVRYREDAELDAREALCPDPHREQARFAWTPLADAADSTPRLGESVPLARVRVHDGTLDVWLDGRRGARTVARTRLAAGSAVVDLPTNGPLRATFEIDTSSGRFHDTPEYFASLSTREPSERGPLHESGLAGPFLSISSPSASAFTLHVCYGTPETGPLPEAEPELRVDWIGIEQIRGCWPPVRPARALIDAGVPIAALDSPLSLFTRQPALGPLVRTIEERQ
jgi:hypothetical protein